MGHVEILDTKDFDSLSLEIDIIILLFLVIITIGVYFARRF